MNGIKQKRSTMDITALTREDWNNLSDLMKKARRLSEANEFESDAAERLIAQGVSNHTQLARRIKSARNQRDRFFDANLFSEPVWDMLLTLYIADTEGYRMGISDVSEACNIPSTTGLRWIGRLQELDLVQRYRHPTDGRIIFLALTPAGFSRMTALLDAIARRLYADG